MSSEVKRKFSFDLDAFRFLKAYTLCKGKADYPFRWLMIEPTNHCNLQCVMCPQSGKMKREKGFMDFELFKKIIDESSGFLKTLLLYHTGEAFLHPRIFDMIRYATSNGIYTKIHTNATTLDEHKALAILDSGLHSLSFSFDSFDKERYETVRIGADYEKTLKNIERFLNLKKEKKRKLPETIIEIIEMDDNKKYIRSFFRKAKEMDFDKVEVWKYHNWSDSDNFDNPGNLSEKKERYFPCEYPFYQMAIYWDGTVVPCCVDYDGAYVLGNVNDESLMSIWNNQKIINLRNTMRSRNSIKTDLCKDCTFLKGHKSFKSMAGRIFHCYSGLVGTIRR